MVKKGSENSQESKTPKIPVWDLPDVPKGELPPHVELQRTRVHCTLDAPTHVFILLPLLISYYVSLIAQFNVIFLLLVVGKLKTESIRYSGAYAAMGVDNSLRLEEFRNKFKVEVIKLTEDDMEFDMIGIDPALANAFRRILISEVLFSFGCSFTSLRSIVYLLIF